MQKIITLLFVALTSCMMRGASTAPFQLLAGCDATLYVSPDEAQVVQTAADLFSHDFERVFDAHLTPASLNKADVVVGTLTNKDVRRWAIRHGIRIDSLQTLHEGFHIEVVTEAGKCRLAVLGSDKRGTAYGLMTLSQHIGVSPWVWWADCQPAKQTRFALPLGYHQTEAPSVKQRGIFINDEDWGLTPWASQNYEPRMRALQGGSSTPVKGEVGPHTHARIFELLLRLRANLFWPAMHGCSVPFYNTAGNQAEADKYGIQIGTSHCEPMMCNANGEWAIRGKGEYDFVHNRAGVVDFWTQRVKALAASDGIYTLGMRGVHDGPMQGAKTIGEQVSALTDIIRTQRELLATYVNKDVTQIPQVFVPYKEVLDCYHAGLEIPQDVTLIWCDDNYGYIRHFPTPAEAARKGGNGIYYHISYWGRPHDYLWLSTQSPELVQEELLRAYRHGVKDLWILNVGDIKPGEFLISQFMQQAWNIESLDTPQELSGYLTDWYSRQLGMDASPLQAVWQAYYRLAFELKPEFTGGTRTEEADPRWKQPADVDLTEAEINARLRTCAEMEATLHTLSTQVPLRNQSAWFELVEYPIRALCAMNQKNLGAQLARHGLSGWEQPHAAYKRIQHLTAHYNALEQGKWQGMMDCHPRNLADFDAPIETTDTASMPTDRGTLVFQSKAMIGDEIVKGKVQQITLPVSEGAQTYEVTIHALPVHPTDGNAQRFEVQLDNQSPVCIDIRTEGRSEEWKQNVLYNRATRKWMVTLTPGDTHTLHIRALDDAVFLQRVYLKGVLNK